MRVTSARTARPPGRVWHHGEQMSKSNSSRFPVTVTRLPVSRCQICQRTFAARTGQASAVLTEHYLREHPDILAAASRRPG